MKLNYVQIREAYVWIIRPITKNRFLTRDSFKKIQQMPTLVHTIFITNSDIVKDKVQNWMSTAHTNN
jgi:hypothetical protein